MKKKVLSTKLTLKKIKIVEMGSEKSNHILGGTGTTPCIETAACPTQFTCPTADCPVPTNGCPFTKTCEPTWQRYCSVQLCPNPTLQGCPSFPQICPI